MNNKHENNSYLKKIIQKFEASEYEKFKEEDFVNLIFFYIKNKDLNYAEKIHKIAAIRFPASYELKISKIQILIEKKQNFEAEKHIKKLLKLNYLDIRLWLFRGINYASMAIFNKSVKIFDFIEKEFTFDKKRVFHNIAQIFMNHLRYDIAARYLRKALEEDENDVDIILDLAFCYEKEGDYSQSINLYLKYASIDAFSKEVWHNLGILYSKTGNYKKAIEAYNFALALEEDYYPVLINKANVYLKRGFYMHALRLVKRSEKIHPEDPDLLYLKGAIFYNLKLYKKSLYYLKKSYEKGNRSAELKKYLLDTYCKTNPQEALKFIKHILSKDRTDHKMWFYAAKYFEKRNNFDKSLIALKKAIKNFPYDKDYWLLTADVLLNSGKIDASIKNLLLAKLFLKENEIIYLKIVSILLISGKINKAKKIFNEIIKKDKKAFDKLAKIHPEQKHLNIFK